jgi:hypothetical protein
LNPSSFLFAERVSHHLLSCQLRVEQLPRFDYDKSTSSTSFESFKRSRWRRKFRVVTSQTHFILRILDYFLVEQPFFLFLVCHFRPFLISFSSTFLYLLLFLRSRSNPLD